MKKNEFFSYFVCVEYETWSVVAIYGHQLQPQADLFFIAINVTARESGCCQVEMHRRMDEIPSLLRLGFRSLESSSFSAILALVALFTGFFYEKLGKVNKFFWTGI